MTRFSRAIRLANLKNAGPRFQYNCVLCKIKFRKVKDKVSHYKNHHMKEDGTFLCTICNQVFQK